MLSLLELPYQKAGLERETGRELSCSSVSTPNSISSAVQKVHPEDAVLSTDVSQNFEPSRLCYAMVQRCSHSQEALRQMRQTPNSSFPPVPMRKPEGRVHHGGM